MHLNMAYIASIGKLYTEMVVFCPCWLTPMCTLQRRQDSCLKGSRCREETGATSVKRFERSNGLDTALYKNYLFLNIKLMLEALYLLYQEACWGWMQQRDQTELRRNYMDRLVRDIQQAFASGDRKSARLLSKQLESEHIATLRALEREFTAAGRMQSATFAYWETFMQGMGTLLRLLRAERDGWSFRTASHRRLRDHSLVSSCRQRQLRQIFAWVSE